MAEHAAAQAAASRQHEVALAAAKVAHAAAAAAAELHWGQQQEQQQAEHQQQLQEAQQQHAQLVQQVCVQALTTVFLQGCFEVQWCCSCWELRDVSCSCHCDAPTDSRMLAAACSCWDTCTL